MSAPVIVLLAGEGESTDILYHALVKEFSLAAVIIEAPVNRKVFLKKRIKKLGLPKVLAQLMFQVMVVPLLASVAAKRKKEILTTYDLNNDPVPESVITRVDSVNDDNCLALLQQLKPDVIIVNGTRIISSRILKSVNAFFVNTHAGITPAYRGVHGGYWANVKNDLANCGVTVHLVDPGIDTGGILFQQTIAPTSRDNFVTYPFLQLAAGIPLMKKAITAILSRDLKQVSGPPASRLWSHPGIFEYLYHRWFRGKK